MIFITNGRGSPPGALPGAAVVAGALALWVCASITHAAPEKKERIYRYDNKAGRPVFVNGLSRVPRKHRAKAREVDLSRISLNKELASDLDREYRRVMREEEERRKKAQEESAGGGICGGGRDRNASWLSILWEEHDYLICIAAVFLGMLLATPYLMKRINPDRWMRILMLTLPMLVALAIFSYATVRTSQVYRELGACIPPPSAAPPGGTAAGPGSSGQSPAKPLHQLRTLLKRSAEQRRQLMEEIER